MERAVNGIRNTFFRDLTEDYLNNKKRSAIYKIFWCEKMTELVEEHFPALADEKLAVLIEECFQAFLENKPLEPAGSARLMAQICGAMRDDPERARGLLLHAEGWRQRRNLWEELVLNDIGYMAGLITDSEYYLWLAEYMAAHDVFKDVIYLGREKETLHGQPWVEILLCHGLDMDLSKLRKEIRLRKRTQIKDEKHLSPTETDEALAMLAEQIRLDRDTVAGRLHDLTVEGGKEDYLPWLTACLEWMALHSKIKVWLQDSGYPLKIPGTAGVSKSRKSAEDADRLKKERKKEITMRRFEAFCDSDRGYDFIRKSEPGGKSSAVSMGMRALPGGWYLDGHGFCILDTDAAQLKALINAHRRAQGRTVRPTWLYIPLAVHLESGCVFFLAGKGYYKRVYAANDKLSSVYKETKKRYCFDYLRQDPSAYETVDSKKRLIPLFRLMPTFHEAGDDYDAALNSFRHYCAIADPTVPKPAENEDGTVDRKHYYAVTVPDSSALHTVRSYNEYEEEDFPEQLRWAFKEFDLDDYDDEL